MNMQPCLYCTTPNPRDRQTCSQCGAPLPWITTEEGIPLFEAYEATAELWFRQPPEPDSLCRFEHHQIHAPAGTDYSVFQFPRYGYLAWIGINATMKRFLRARVIVNGSLIVADLPPMPIPLSWRFGIKADVLVLERLTDARLEIHESSKDLPAVTYTIMCMFAMNPEAVA